MRRTTISPSRLVLLATLAGLAPAGLAAQKPATHTVQRGETLWALAQRYLGDPFLWPQIFRLNTDTVEDPHWIYPGEVLRLAGGEGAQAVPAEGTPAAAAAPAPAATPAAPDAGEYPMPEFAQRRSSGNLESLQAYTENAYQPLRPGEFYGSPWLTEEQPLPSGRFLGQLTPPQIDFIREGAPAAPHAKVGMQPPPGTDYAVNDTLVVFERELGFAGYGDIVVPTGMVRVTGRSDQQVLGEVVAVYGAMRHGQEVMPSPRYRPGPMARPVPVRDTLTGTVLGARERRQLKEPLHRILIDLGSRDGVAPGDVFEIRRVPGPRPMAAHSEPELMARGQVVRVGDRSATLLLTSVISPNIPGGMTVRRVARLPG
jgi:LysM repeat protein